MRYSFWCYKNGNWYFSFCLFERHIEAHRESSKNQPDAVQRAQPVLNKFQLENLVPLPIRFFAVLLNKILDLSAVQGFVLFAYSIVRDFVSSVKRVAGRKSSFECLSSVGEAFRLLNCSIIIHCSLYPLHTIAQPKKTTKSNNNSKRQTKCSASNKVKIGSGDVSLANVNAETVSIQCCSFVYFISSSSRQNESPGADFNGFSFHELLCRNNGGRPEMPFVLFPFFELLFLLEKQSLIFNFCWKFSIEK